MVYDWEAVNKAFAYAQYAAQFLQLVLTPSHPYQVTVLLLIKQEVRKENQKKTKLCDFFEMPAELLPIRCESAGSVLSGYGSSTTGRIFLSSVFDSNFKELKYEKQTFVYNSVDCCSFCGFRCPRGKTGRFVGEEEAVNAEMSANDNSELQGGAILNSGKLTVADGVVFNGNAGSVGGAVSTVDASGAAVIGDNVSFIGNTSAMQGGAYHNQRATSTIGDNAKFHNNTAIGYGGGAVYQDTDGREAVLTIGDNAEFKGNKSETSHGGAVMNFNAGDKAEITIGKNAVFSGNSAGKTGGAVANWGGSMRLGEGASFAENRAATDGGAVYNANYGGKNAEMTIAGVSVFENNEATGLGGAVYNDGKLNMGGAVFSGNKAGGKLNDVYNAGELNFTGDVTLDGGIAGNGTTTFAKDTVLTVKTGTTTISNDVVNKGATLSLVFANGYAGGEYDLITEEGSLDKEFNIAQNALYNIKANENGSYTISKKTAGDFVASTGANVNQANTISAVAGSKTGSARFDAVAERIGGLIQSAHASDVQTALNAATALAPEVAPMVTQSESQTVNQVFGAVSTRLSGGAIAAAGEAGAEGVSSGDNVFERVAMWIQGMFNRSELDDTAKTKGFDADSAGVAMGLEKRVNDQVKLGIGYAYTNTDIDGFMRSTDVDTHTAILYGEYKPSAWFVNGVVSYGWSDYSESKNVAGYNVNADYDATSLGLQAMTGYEMQVKGFNLTPEAGLRYVHTSQDAYTDTVDQRVSANDSDILTGVIGAKADREFTLENEMTLRPEVRVALTYDMFNDAGGSVVTLANGAAYRVDGEALDRFGVELGAGLTAEVNDNVELSLRYEGQFRDDYTDHTGLLNAKYKF